MAINRSEQTWPESETVSIERHISRTFDTSTVHGLNQAERFKARLNDRFDSVTVYAIGLNRVRIVGLNH